MLDRLWRSRSSWIVGKRLECCRSLRFRSLLSHLSLSIRPTRCSSSCRKGSRIAGLPIMVGWILDRNILQISYHRTHYIFVGCWRSWPIQYFHLIMFQLSLNSRRKFICVFGCPEIDIQCMKAEEVLTLIPRVGVWQSPVVFWLLDGRRRFSTRATISVYRQCT